MSSNTKFNIQPVMQRFSLLDNTKKDINNLTPKFGFNGLGEVVFRRTYSRDNESWNDVVVRVVEGVICLLYTSPSPRDNTGSRMPSSA